MSIRLVASASRALAGAERRRRGPNPLLRRRAKSTTGTGFRRSDYSNHREAASAPSPTSAAVPFAGALLALPLVVATGSTIEEESRWTWTELVWDGPGRWFGTHEGPKDDWTENGAVPPREASPEFPTLSASLVVPGDGPTSSSSESRGELRPNAPSPIPFETDLFEGHVVFLLRPDSAEHDPVFYDRVFSGAAGGDDRTQIFMQVQGRFKRRPEGTVYMGLELPLTEDVEERLLSNKLTRALSRMLLRLVRRIEPRVHFSYGSAAERPHIVAPIESTVDRVIASSASAVADGRVPRLGFAVDDEEDFPADESSPAPESWNTDDVYTFTFSNYHVNFSSWRLVNMPLGPETVSLRRFWGDENAVRLIAYEAEDGKDHNVDEIRYLFCAEVETKLDREGERVEARLEREERSATVVEAGCDNCEIQATTAGVTGIFFLGRDVRQLGRDIRASMKLAIMEDDR